MQSQASRLGPRPSRFRSYRVDLPALTAQLEQAPAGVEITLPLPDGRIERFRVVDAPILSPELQRAHPELRTYRGVGIDDPSLQARLDLTPLGIRAMVLTTLGTALLDPLQLGSTDRVMSYWARDDAFAPFECDVRDLAAAAAESPGAEVRSGGDQLTTYRFVIMATGEYTQALGGVPQALSQLTTAMNRINAIYERDAAVHFEIVHMNAFDDPATDPYPTNTAGQILNRDIVVVDSLYDHTSYDMSQTVSITGAYAGGSQRPSQCDSTSKPHSGVTGPDPMANQFIEHVMPHEIGHMLGATHTQDRSCNRSLTPYEPLSGLTIMSSLGGACIPDIQPYADPYLHVCSIEQIDTVLTHPPGGCGTQTPTGNTPPTANAGSDYTIPRGTPFVLSGSGSDPDAGDALTYTWEEMDMAPTSGDLTLGPLFRWRPPTTTPVRALPALATVLSGTPDPLEKLPTVDRLLHFRLVVRDNHAGIGGHAWDEMIVTVSGAPFAVTFPNGGNSIDAGQPFTVTWSVGGGSVASNVNVLLSTNGGASWTALASSTPNDGSESVTYYNSVTNTACRIKVEAVGNIFYDVSDANFTIVGHTGVEALELPPTLEITAVTPNPAARALEIDYANPRSQQLRLRVLDVQGRIVATLADGVRPAGRYHVTWSGETARGRAAGLYFVSIEAPGVEAARRVVILR